jgi:outer membrane protein TolC
MAYNGILHFGMAGLCALAVAGCAQFSRDGGFDQVARASRERIGGEVRWARTPEERARSDRQIADLLRHPLSVDDAVQIALLGNAGLQASFEELGISEADLVQSGRLPNPGFTFRHAASAGVYDIEETLSVNVIALLTAPSRHRIRERRFRETQDAVTLGIVELAARTREAYYTALAAGESIRHREEVQAAADAGAELARRMRAAGNWNRLDEAHERGFYDDASLQLQRARLAESVAHENLARLLALGADSGAGPGSLRLVDRLPELPATLEEAPDFEKTALAGRIDLQLMRNRVDALAENLHLTRSTRVIDVLEAGPTRIRQGAASDPYEGGYQVSLQIPLFDTGAARVRKSEAIYARALEEFRQAAIDARSEVQAAYARYRASYAIALRERDEVLPLRQSISREDLMLYNASQISVFDLLADARLQSAGVDDFIQSLRDFWVAKSALDAAMLGPNPQRSAGETSW